MEAAAARDEQLIDRGTAQAWQTAIFALNGYGGKLKGKTLSDYLIGKPKEDRSAASRAVAFFHAMKAAGLDVMIEKVALKPDQSRPQ